MRRRFAACYVALTETGRVVGYYTLSSASLCMSDLPEEKAKKLPHYQNVPVALLGRLAIDQSRQRQGLGDILLADAYQRVKHSEIASYALLVEPKNKAAQVFYGKFGFVPLPNSVPKMLLPLI